jgi:3-phenylpropionate/trans-cinnamate dioxygenase ferredoxin reductase component
MPSRSRETHVVIGGGPAGLEAARAYREGGGEGAVTLVSADEFPPYNRPPLSKDFLRGESDESDLPLEEETFYKSKEIEVILDTKATALRPHQHLLTLSDGTDLAYDTCILATGARPTPLPAPGAQDPGVRYLRSRRDARTLRQTAASSRSSVVIGSGFIGCEAAASLARRGLDVTLVTMEELPQIHRLGRGAGERLSHWLHNEGVVRLGVEVAEVRGNRLVRLSDGTTVEGDLILVAGGVKPEAALAKDAGLDMAQDRVRVDAHMRSSHPDVLAAGDVTFAYNTGAERHLTVEHWGEALTMGRVAGATAAGRDTEWCDVPGFWSTIGDRTLKYAAWGDGFDSDHPVDHGNGAFTIWYERDGVAVGVLTHEADDDYALGKDLIGRHRPAPIEGRWSAPEDGR